MKKITKKSLLLFFLLSVALSVNCFAKSDFSYKLDASGNATITAYNGNKSELTIPSKIDGHKVVAIARHAFDENRNNTNGHTIKKLVISEGITRIEDFAFIECQNLQSVKLPESLTYIGSMAFLRCTNLKSINIPSKIEALYGSTFQETGFTEFTIPKTLKSIQSREFASCKNLKKVIVYNKNLPFYLIVPSVILPDGTEKKNYKLDSEAFYSGNKDLVIYGYNGSTAQKYAKAVGIKFSNISNLNNSNKTQTTKKASSLILDKHELSLKEGEKATFKITYRELPTNTKTIWSSSNNKVATINNGIVTAISEGNAVITVSTLDKKYTDTCKVSVKKLQIQISKITLDKTSISLYEGETGEISVSLTPNNTTEKEIIWKSLDEEIAQVENGIVIAKTSGTTTIIVSSANGKVQAKCEVNVTKKEIKEEVKKEEIKKEVKQDVKKEIAQETNDEDTSSNSANVAVMTVAVILLMTIIGAVFYKKLKDYS